MTVFLVLAELRATGVTLFFYSLYLVAQLSITDVLTGLPNRRSYELVWDQLSSLAVRQRTPLALLVMDLDQFKRVNDRHGHLGGDRVETWAGERP